MEAGNFRFTLGSFGGAALCDGALNYPPRSLFANVAQDQLDAALRARGLPTDRVETPYTCLFIDTGRHKVMVDTGAGGLGTIAPRMFPGIDHTTSVTGLLVDSLRGLCVAPDDVDTVIISHAHPDHVGGTLDLDGRPIFRNARYYIGRAEWAFWMSADAATRTNPLFVAIARHNLEPVRDQLEEFDDGDVIVPGVRAIATPGHTPGHMALAFQSGGKLLLHVSDAALYPLLIEHPDWRPSFDMDHEQAAASKRMIFDMAAGEGALVFAHHFPPFPNLGRVRKSASGWHWNPIGVAIESQKEVAR